MQILAILIMQRCHILLVTITTVSLETQQLHNKLDHLYSSDPLWDGEQCEGECCSNGKSPPWFSVELPNPTTDDIEVRICGYHRTANAYGDVAVQELDIYIQ